MKGRFQVDVRLIGAGILAASTALIVLLLTSPPARHEVLVTRSGAAAGITFDRLDLGTRLVEDPTGLVVSAESDTFQGHVLAASLTAGAPIPRSLLLSPVEQRGTDLLGLEVDSAAAVHGLLEGGDEVDVYAGSEEVSLIASGVSVVDVAATDGSLGSGRVRLVVAVEGDLALRLIAASRAGTLHLVRRGR